MRVCFLYNHDAAHQIAHSIGIAAALAETNPDAEITIAYSSAEIKHEITKFLGADQSKLLRWYDINLGHITEKILSPLNRLFPARRILRLFKHQKTLRSFDLIVSTERTCLILKRRWKDKGPRFVFVPHGSGDRNVTYHQEMADFDYMMLSGNKVANQMVAHKLVKEDRYHIIGYPKFDSLRTRQPERFFQNDNPVFLYCPHFEPVLSSWYDEGVKILEWFAANPQYNLIFAPHVMLFYKKLHISPEYRRALMRPNIPAEIYASPNILIDTDSPRLFDMSYTFAADVYIGDVSSQIYEFLYRPRTAFFLDTHSKKLGIKGNPPYEFWENGPVVKSAEDLFALLPKWQEIGAEYHERQVELMQYTADNSDPRLAGERGAEALAAIMREIKS